MLENQKRILGNYIGMILGPSMHLGYLTYIFGSNIQSIAQYAEMSLALPISFLLMLFAILALPLLQLHRRSARLSIIIWGTVYIAIASAMPWLGDIFTIARMLIMTPWLLEFEVSPIWTVISLLLIFAYGISITAVCLYELKGTSRLTLFEKAKKFGLKSKLRHRGTLTFLAALIISGVLITGNQIWFRYTYRLQYNADIDMAIEYWIGVDEQEFNGTFTITNSTPITQGVDISISLTQLFAIDDPFYAARFLIDGDNDTYRNYQTWYYLGADFLTLYMTNLPSAMAHRMEAAANGTKPLNMRCVGYYESRLQALKQTHAVIVLAGGLGITVPHGFDQNTPEFNATCWLYYKWGIKIQAPHGCGIGFLEDYEMLSKELLEWQDTRVRGPYYYRAVIEGAMYNVEKIDKNTRTPLVESYYYNQTGRNVTGQDSDFAEWYWAQNSLTEEEYWAWINKWNLLIDGLYNNITWPNGTEDLSLRFKLINCGIQENLIDYFDGDPDYAMYYHNLGYGTHFAVDGYMFYRGDDEPYWTYGYVNLLSQKPKNVPHEEKLVLLGCMNTPPYRYDFELEKGSRFHRDGKDWTRDINGDGLANGFDVLMLDIMMCGAKEIRRVNLWPGPGPRSPSCCDYRQFPRDLMPNGDFFIEMAKVLSESCEIEFQFAPGEEHFWDKELVDILMDFRRPKGFLAYVIGIVVLAAILTKNINFLKKLEAID
jgi:hypothetical protein